MIPQVDDRVISTREIKLTAPSDIASVPMGTEGRIRIATDGGFYIAWYLDVSSISMWVDRSAFELREDYWKRRALKAEAILDNLTSLAICHTDGSWGFLPKSEKRIREIITQLAEERRSTE